MEKRHHSVELLLWRAINWGNGENERLSRHHHVRVLVVSGGCSIRFGSEIPVVVFYISSAGVEN